MGSCRLKINAVGISADHWVLIENQLERTDHNHLGQLLTYASGLEAVTIVWIAANFTEEHRSTLDWLNRITDESFSFFGLEVELWRIGDSLAAPKFNIISKPNDWSQSVSRGARRLDDEELSELRLLQCAYWEALQAVLNRMRGQVSGNRKAWPRSWIACPIGDSRLNLAAVMIRSKNKLRAELYIKGDQAKALFALLQQDKDSIERELGFPLDWEELPERRDCRVASYMSDVDPENKADWPRQHEWLAERLNAMHGVFVRRVHGLDVDELET